MFLERASEFFEWRFVQDLVWEKQNGSGFINDRFKRVHEAAYQFVPKRTLWRDVFKSPQFTHDATARTVRRKARPPHMGDTKESTFVSLDGGPRLMRSVIYSKNCHGSAVNETQKPMDLLGVMMRYSCPPGGLVLSPFMGSGTDLVVAKAHGMRAIGFDKREGQCEEAAKRLAQENLFAGMESTA
jgi:site-specific DNA-methyltransferase (adenine-specific)